MMIWLKTVAFQIKRMIFGLQPVRFPLYHKKWLLIARVSKGFMPIVVDYGLPHA
jgi:hypothetical protein